MEIWSTNIVVNQCKISIASTKQRTKIIQKIGKTLTRDTIAGHALSWLDGWVSLRFLSVFILIQLKQNQLFIRSRRKYAPQAFSRQFINFKIENYNFSPFDIHTHINYILLMFDLSLSHFPTNFRMIVFVFQFSCLLPKFHFKKSMRV